MLRVDVGCPKEGQTTEQGVEGLEFEGFEHQTFRAKPYTLYPKS